MIMKKVFNSLFVIIAAMVTFAGCAKQEIDAPATVETKAVQFFAESIETKTHFGEKNDENKYPTLWDAGDKVKVLLNLEQIDGVSGLEKTVTAEISGDAKSARFVAELNSTYEFDAYTFYAVVPSTAYNTKNATEGKLTVVIPDTQEPQETSVDKSAQVLYAVSSTTDHFPTSVQMNFKHFVAYGKLSLANLTDKVTSISSVKLSFEENVAGKWNYLVADGSIEAKEAAKEIVLNTTSIENVWFACAPVDMSGKKMTVTVNTDKGPLSKEVTFPANRKFESGKISVLTINMEGIEPEEQGETVSYYEKVTAEPADWSGKYLIVWGNNAHATLSSKDLKSTCSVTIVDNKIAAIDAVNAAAMTVTKAGDNYNMTYPDGKYFAVAHNSSSSSTSAFTLSFAYTASGVKISGQATNSGTTSTYILYNQSNQYYRCYVDKSNDSKYTLPSLYKLVEDDNGGETPEEPEVPEEPETPVDPTPDPEEPAGPQVVTVAEFLAAAAGDKEYQLTGVMSGTYNTTYGNFYLEDETGKVLVYGLTKTKVSENDKSFASIGLRDGDTLTLIGTRADYNGTAQVGGPAYYISHVAAPYIDLDNAVATVDAEATTYAIAVTSNCAWTAVASTGVTLDKSSATGNATVNMTFAANETEDAVTHTVTFTSGSLTQTFTLTQNGVVTGDTVEPVKATLSFADKAQRTTFTSTQQIWEQNGIKVTNNKASSSNAVADYAKPARFYAGSNLEVTAPGAISMIVFDANSSSYATAMKNSIGTVSGATVTVSSDKVTVTFTTAVESFVVAKLTAQVRMDSITVTYIPEN